jgi:tetratricopeptide (TPR) repeat protein
MKAKIPGAALLLILVTGNAFAFPGNGNWRNPHAQGRSYASFLAGYLAAKEGRFDDALAEYKKAQDYAGADEPEILFETAGILVKRGNLVDAGKLAERVLAVDDNNARARYLLAGVQAATGRKEQALASYQRILADDPDNEEVYVHISTLYADMGDPDKAEKQLTALVEKSPDSFLAHYYRGRLRAARKMYQPALDDFDNAATLQPGFDSALIEGAAVLEAMGRNADAESRYRQVLEANPNNPFVRERLGRVLILENKIDAAVDQFEVLKTQAGSNADFRTKLGLLYLDRGRYDDAIIEFRFVITAQPLNHQVRFFLGNAYEEKGDIAEAQAQYRGVPAESPYFRDANLHLAMLLRQEKKFDEAAKVAAALREREPADPDLMTFNATILEDAKRYDEALALLKQAAVKSPKNSAIMFGIGVIQDKLGRFDDLVTAMESAIALDPNNATALNYLGYTYADRNLKLPEAESLIERALKVRPGDGFFLDSLAWVYYRQGRFEKAEETLRGALGAVPDDPVVLEHMGDIQSKLGKKADAIGWYEKALAKGAEKPDELRAKVESLKKDSAAK